MLADFAAIYQPITVLFLPFGPSRVIANELFSGFRLPLPTNYFIYESIIFPLFVAANATKILMMMITQIFFSFFKTLVGKEVAVELKNDVVMTGTLHSVDQYLNIKLIDVRIVNPTKYPQLVALTNCFVRGSVVRYVQIPPEHVDTELLQDAARKENAPAAAGGGAKAKA